jgi:protein-S-isoprenylcysteine O-methyltransferase Ste14
VNRILVFVYGLLAYAIALGVFVYLVGFMCNLWVPKSIDSGPQAPLSVALLVDLGLIGAFAVQHSVMARPTFKRWLTRFIPASIERSTYVMASNICMALIFALWQPISAPLWDVQSPVARSAILALCLGGFGLVLFTTFLINHFDLFGLRQVWLRLRGREYTPVGFVQPFLYRFVRHPLYVGWMTFFWVTPTMSVGHLLFAAATTLYMLVAIQFEERNLIEEHGEKYLAYRRVTPMLVPIPRRAAGPAQASAHAAA